MRNFTKTVESEKILEKDENIEKQLELDILKARVLIVRPQLDYIQSNPFQAENSYSYALSVILNCIPISEQHYLSAQELRAKVVLAHILFKMGLSASAKEIVQDLISERIDPKDREYEAYLYEVLANCCISEDESGYEAKGYFKQALEGPLFMN